jgi:ABC-type phosphonate transport system ATPase subunit
MKQRFGIAQALIGEPKLITVDEPTAGLIPVVLQLVVLCGGLVIQLSQGYGRHELGLYLRALFGLNLIDYAQLCASPFTACCSTNTWGTS